MHKSIFIVFLFVFFVLSACDKNEVFTPDSNLEDNYYWMDGVVNMEYFEEKDGRYYLVMSPGEGNLDEYKRMIVDFGEDVKIINDNKILSIDDFRNIESDPEVQIAVYLNENVGEGYLTGKVTDILLINK